MMEYFESAVSVVDTPSVPELVADTFWNTDLPVMADGKLVRGGMWPHQYAWWSAPNFIKVLVGGYGAGKTSVLCKRAIAVAIQNAPAMIAIVSPTYPIARKTILVTLREQLAGKQSLYGNAFTWRENKSLFEFKIYFRGRTATIMVLSGEDPDSLRGPNLAAAYIDEPFIQEVAVFEQMMARIRHPDSVISELGMCGTPEQLNWGYDLCVGDLKKTNDVAMVQASTRANLVLKGYAERLEGILSKQAVKAYVEGEFTPLNSGLVYYGFNPMPGGNVQALPMPEYAELGAGMDFNVNPMASTVFWKAGSHMHFFDEFEFPNADTEFACAELKTKYPTLANIYPDATGSARKTSAPGGKTDFFYIRAAGFTVNAKHANPKHRDRWNAVNGKLAPKTGPITITVDPKCTKLIKYLSLYSHDEMNKPEQIKMSHLLDAFGYPVSYLFPVDGDSVRAVRLSGY